MSANPHKLNSDRAFFGRVEALRGLGAMAVAGYHFSGCSLHGFTLLQHEQWPTAAADQFAIARVTLFLLPGHAFLMAFFVISGFVLRLSLQHGPSAAPAAAAKFVVARLFRFYPIVVVAVLLAAMTAPVHSVYRLVANLLLIDVTMNSHLWALQIELCMVPVILALFFLERRWGPYLLLVIALTTTGLSFVPRWAAWPPLSINLFAFPLGMTIPTLGRRFAMGLTKGTATCWLVSSAAVLFAAGPCLGVYSRFTIIVEAYAAVVALSLVAYRSEIPGLGWLDARRLTRVGSASGSYYVLHMATLPAGMAVATLVIPAAWSAHAPGVVGVAVIAIWLVAIAPLMVCVFHLIEAPGIALGQRLIRCLGLDSRPQPHSDRSSLVVRQAA